MSLCVIFWVYRRNFWIVSKIMFQAWVSKKQVWAYILKLPVEIAYFHHWELGLNYRLWVENLLPLWLEAEELHFNKRFIYANYNLGKISKFIQLSSLLPRNTCDLWKYVIWCMWPWQYSSWSCLSCFAPDDPKHMPFNS
jgi:hypothetical protein